jgi:hypothetical protein
MRWHVCFVMHTASEYDAKRTPYKTNLNQPYNDLDMKYYIFFFSLTGAFTTKSRQHPPIIFAVSLCVSPCRNSRTLEQIFVAFDIGKFFFTKIWSKIPVLIIIGQKLIFYRKIYTRFLAHVQCNPLNVSFSRDKKVSNKNCKQKWNMSASRRANQASTPSPGF